MTALTIQLEDSVAQRLTKKARGINLQTYIERLLLMELAMERTDEKSAAADSRSLSSLYGLCPLAQGETIENLRSEAMEENFHI